jgi:hypothetical protein
MGPYFAWNRGEDAAAALMAMAAVVAAAISV